MREPVSKDAVSPAAVDRLVDLDVIGAIEGADKSSSVAFAWDYLRHYDSLFRPYREAAINLIEIGVQAGPSLRVWQWYFPVATIVGIDIDPACAALASGRVRIEIGSQADPAFLSAVCAAHPPTIFIDDGSHRAHHNIFTFEHVFPLLLPGGIYVVEDLKFHFGPNAAHWQGPVPRNAPEYFLDLARNCVAGHATPGAETVTADLVDMIDSVAFIGGAVIVTKRRTARLVSRAATVGRAYLADRHRAGGAHLRLAEYLSRHGARPAEVLASCDAALAADGPSLPALTLKAGVLLRSEREAEAVALLEQAAALRNSDPRALMRLARQFAAARLPEQAAQTARRVLEIEPGHEAARQMLAKLGAALV